jgi:hypothetical protein
MNQLTAPTDERRDHSRAAADPHQLDRETFTIKVFRFLGDHGHDPAAGCARIQEVKVFQNQKNYPNFS